MNEDQNKINWWEEKYGFFGEFYIKGDDSVNGYLQSKKQTLGQRTIAEVNGVEKVMNLSPGMSILDIPCGYGRHSIELSKRGYKVIGGDINSFHLEKAKEAAKKEGVQISFNKLNMIDIAYSNQFDALINMFYSFGFFETDKQNERVLLNFYNALKIGGRFLMHTDVNIPRILSGKYKEDETRNLASGSQLRIIDKYNSETKRIEGTWIIKETNGIDVRKDYSVRVYTKDEFTQMCLKVGFRDVEVYGDWDKAVYSEECEDMMVVATK